MKFSIFFRVNISFFFVFIVKTFYEGIEVITNCSIQLFVNKNLLVGSRASGQDIPLSHTCLMTATLRQSPLVVSSLSCSKTAY